MGKNKKICYFAVLFFLTILLINPANAYCIITCNKNTDCDDGDPLTIDECHEPKTCDSSCTHNYCEPDCTSNADCDDEDGLTLDVCAGAGRCEASCSHLARCGNGTCEAEESRCNCPADCGECTGKPRGVCRQFACIGTACKDTIILNCCGNAKCEYNEDYSNCPGDCTPKRILVDFPGCTRTYVRGDIIEIRAAVEADGVKIKDATVRAEGFFGREKIYNDGEHDDGTPYDNIYANKIVVGKDVEEGTYDVIVEAEFLGTKGFEITQCIVDPTLEMNLKTVKKVYFLGDNITISGYVRKRGVGISLPVKLNVVADGEAIIEEDINSDSQGNFSFSYHSSLLDSLGLWEMKVTAEDENRNSGLAEWAVNFLLPGATVSLDLGVEGVKDSYSRGETVDLTITVTGVDSALLENATVEVVGFNSAIYKLEEVSPGKYAGLILLGYDAPLEKQQWEITASKKDMNINYSGRKTIDFNVNVIEFAAELLEPEERLFKIGDTLNFKVRLTYPDGQSVTGAEINGLINEKRIQMSPIEKGIYVGKYILQEEDAGEISFSIEPRDSYGNTAPFEVISIEVSGVAYTHYIRKYSLPAILFALAGILILVRLYIYSATSIKLRKLKKREGELLEILKDLQRKYFKEKVMDAKEYNAQLSKYEAELADVRKSIQLLTKKREKKEGLNV